MIRFACFSYASALAICASAALVLLAGACNSPAPAQPEEVAEAAPQELPGKLLFTQNCVVCHGPDGKLGLNGAHDLTKSNLNATGRVYIVTQGLGKMPAFKDQLSAEQIEQVVAYSLTLR
ncbi:c-type cytochrome [Hymenobacter elongatus]|uniref:Cytochrome c n=1 Tax=Hymenobacter elongatus TaxID=877208 RepID=A0A4Z0PNL9_9BACT|nr:cytochrome c [Hymenobacter elongatus]TGE17779.1 cytochrome c [Hymenobacter elongatus]